MSMLCIDDDDDSDGVPMAKRSKEDKRLAEGNLTALNPYILCFNFLIRHLRKTDFTSFCHIIL